MGIRKKTQLVFPKFDPPFDPKSGSQGQNLTPVFLFDNRKLMGIRNQTQLVFPKFDPKAGSQC